MGDYRWTPSSLSILMKFGENCQVRPMSRLVKTQGNDTTPFWRGGVGRKVDTSCWKGHISHSVDAFHRTRSCAFVLFSFRSHSLLLYDLVFHVNA